jgi:hypothetical protein
MEKHWFLKPDFVKPLHGCILQMTAVGKMEWVGTLLEKVFRLSRFLS